MKPFWLHSKLESYIQVGLAMFAFDREWFDFKGDEFEESFVDGFSFFKGKDPVGNTCSFTYFVNGKGMHEYTLEWSSQECLNCRFLIDNSIHRLHQ